MGVLGFGGLVLYRLARRRTGPASSPGIAVTPAPASPVAHATDDSEYQVSYAPPEFEWSGNSTGSLPVKTLTYKQYECLEDARYGFRIVAVSPTERDLPQPHKTRAHGLKTVASLSRHGFLQADAQGGFTITDLGLNALAVCSVRY
ncbi:MAG: hypothetical protein V4542_20020 [Pseudomonadota bacterium]